MIAQWTPAQVHDTVAAIVAQPAYGGQRRSLLVRFFRFLLDKLDALLHAVRGSLDARIIIASTVVIVVAIIAARVAIDRRAAARRARNPARSRGGVGQARAWSDARALADGGRYEAASHALYSAVLETLTTSGLIRHHRSKTAGDYARELRRSGSPIAPEFRSFGIDFDRVAFGRAPVTRDDYDRLALVAQRIATAVTRPAAA